MVCQSLLVLSFPGCYIVLEGNFHIYHLLFMATQTAENKKLPNGKKVLIVEDEVALLRTLGDSFSEEGFEVLEASTGEKGLELALVNHPRCYFTGSAASRHRRYRRAQAAA